MDLVTGRGCGETAVVGGDDAFAAKHARETEDALGDQLGVLHKRNAVGHDPRDDDFVVREIDLLPDPPLVFVPRIGRLDRVRASADLQHQIDKVFQVQVVDAWCDIGAIAGVETHAILG